MTDRFYLLVKITVFHLSVIFENNGRNEWKAPCIRLFFENISYFPVIALTTCWLDEGFLTFPVNRHIIQ